MKNKKLIIVSGMPHSGTRLIFDIIQKKNNFFLNNNKLNYVNEFPLLHKAYIKKIDEKKRNILLKYQTLKNILNKYINNTQSKNIVIKLPYYPIIDWKNYYKFCKQNKFQLEFLISKRNLKNIYLSFKKRNEDLKYSKTQIYKIPSNVNLKYNKNFKYYLYFQYKIMNQYLKEIQANKISVKFISLNKNKNLNKQKFNFSEKRFKKNQNNFISSIFRFIERYFIIFFKKI